MQLIVVLVLLFNIIFSNGMSQIKKIVYFKQSAQMKQHLNFRQNAQMQQSIQRQPQSINSQLQIIVNLDDIIKFFKVKNLVNIMTQILPLFSKYKDIEFVITEKALNEMLSKFKLFDKHIYAIDSAYHEYVLISIGLLGKKINSKFSIIYSEFPEIAIDYYISHKCTIQNEFLIKNNNFTLLETHVLKQCPISLLKPYWDLALPIKAMNFNRNKINYCKINTFKPETNIKKIITITDFFK